MGLLMETMIRPAGLREDEPVHATKRRLLDVGLATLLERGYNATGIQDLLVATSVPKGSFYHHFSSKEDFALQVIDRYMGDVHFLLDQALSDLDRAPLERIRVFYVRLLAMYAGQGYLGSLVGLLGQELAAVSTSFRRRIEAAFEGLAHRLADAIDEARRRGDVPADTDPMSAATLLIDCWEGAAMRSRLIRSPAPLEAVLESGLPYSSRALDA
jgi:TetR/AcrR family transcriptional regulator, transcriptional repressor for nem operon